MQCENQFCLYWAAEGCALEEISLDVQGCCRQCIYLNLPPLFLERERQKARRRLETEN